MTKPLMAAVSGAALMLLPFATTGCSTYTRVGGIDEASRAEYVREKLATLSDGGPEVAATESGPEASSETEFVPTDEWVPISVPTESGEEVAAPEVGFRTGPANPAPAAARLSGDVMLPPDARPGECYARVYEPARYETRTERVLVKEGGQRIEIIPAEYKMVEEQVLVEAEGERWEVVPAEYKMVEEQVVVSPASTRTEEVPAEYKTIEEKVLVKPATTEWKRGSGPIEKIDGATGEIMCLVEIPAEYKIVTRQQLVKPATTRTVEVPAETKTVTKRVMVKPPSKRVVRIPARHETMLVRREVKPAQKRVIPVEPVYDTVEKQVMVSEGRTAWRRVLCETNLTPETIERIQNALVDHGYDPGEADGKFGPKTQTAIREFQTDRELAVGGLTLETMQHLGLSQ